MVGKLQDVVSAAVVVGAAEKVNVGNTRNAQMNPSAFDAPAATVENSQQSRFVIDTKGVAADNAQAQNQPTQAQVQDELDDIQIKPGSIDEVSLDNITQELNQLMSKINANLQFNYHQEVGVMSIRLVDKETQEVIKELPPEDMIKNMVKSKIWLGAVIGTFVDKSA